MKFRVNKKKFESVIKEISGVISKKTAIPILENVLISSRKVYDDDVMSPYDIVVSATDLEIAVKVNIPSATVEDSGAITVNAKKLLQVLKPIAKDTELVVEVIENKLVIVGNNIPRISLDTLPVEDYPAINEIEGIECNFDKELGGQFIGGIKKGLYFVSTEEMRYAFNGVAIDFRGNGYNLAATDGSRMIVVDNQHLVVNPELKDKIVIVPTKACQLVRKLFNKEDSGIDLVINEGLKDKTIQLSSGSKVVIAKLVDGQFPNYEQVIPKSENIRYIAECSKIELTKALEGLYPLTDKWYHRTVWKFSSTGLEVGVGNEEHSDSKIDIAC